MITYLDSSLIVRAYLPDEPDHALARRLIDDDDHAVITASWTRVEVTSALVRAARANRGDLDQLLAFFMEDIDPIRGTLVMVDVNHAEMERIALDIVTNHGIRSMDALHLASAALSFEDLAEPGEECSFGTRDELQSSVARELGMLVL